MIFVCPKPPVWYAAYERLLAAWRAGGCSGPQPPTPLILNSWVFSSDLAKQEQWRSTIKWAEERLFAHLIPTLAPEEQYCTENLSTSYPEQHYRPDRFVRRERPTNEALRTAME